VLRPVVLRCKVKSCNARLVPVEIEEGRNGLLCERCGAIYCYQRHPGLNHFSVCRYLPRPTAEDLE
jgi:hypothetical protein